MEEKKDVEPENKANIIPEVEHSEMLPSSEATTPFEDNILPEEEPNTASEQSSTDPIVLRKFKNLIYELQFYHRNTIRDNTRLIEKATVLIQALKTQYNLK